MYDNICKFLAETFSSDFATWLLGKPIALTQLSPSELSIEPIRADALILLASDDVVLHIEFQTRPDADIAFRMLDYRLRVYRRFPQKRMLQVVVYLKPSDSELVQQTTFEIPGTRHNFEVIRLWEQPTEVFLNSPGLLPFAVLSQTSDRTDALRQVASQIEEIIEPNLKKNVAASTAILAGLLLEKQAIGQILLSDAMKESVIYQEIKAEGKAEGKLEGELALVLRQLSRRVGRLAPDLQAQVQWLSLAQLEDLGEALLDFSQPDDLRAWLGRYARP